MKICNSCKIEKEVSEFGKLNNGKRLRSFCNKCRNEKAREYRSKNLDKCKKNVENYYKKNRKNILAQQKQHREENREFFLARRRAQRKNITPEQRKKNRIRQDEWRLKNPEKHVRNACKHKIRNPEKHLARTYVMWALKLGVLKKPDQCEKCKIKVKVEAHHIDYSKPLEVNWFCRICHMQEHGKLMDLDPRIENDSPSSRQYLSSYKEKNT